MKIARERELQLHRPGLSLAQLVTLAIGLIAFTSAVYLGGGILFGLTSPIWVTSVALAFVPVGGRKLIEWVPISIRWAWRSVGGPWSRLPIFSRPLRSGSRGLIARLSHLSP